MLYMICYSHTLTHYSTTALSVSLLQTGQNVRNVTPLCDFFSQSCQMSFLISAHSLKENESYWKTKLARRSAKKMSFSPFQTKLSRLKLRRAAALVDASCVI